MGDFNHTTRECAFQQLRPEIAAAIRAHIEKYELGSLEAQALVCCETVSEKKKKGFLSGLFGGGDPDPVHYTGLLLTPAWLIWARSGAKFGTVVSWARLSEIEVDQPSPLLKNLPAAQAAALAKDYAEGLSVFGMINRSPERGSVFIEMDGGPAAQRVKQIIKEAVAKAHQL